MLQAPSAGAPGGRNLQQWENGIMTREEFQELIARVTEEIDGKPLDGDLERFLNAHFPPAGQTFRAIEKGCHAAIESGWMCKHEAGGIRYGRVIPPGPATHGFSVDVVAMNNVKGPHHRHPKGEIGMIMPVTGAPRFDGHGAGWYVYGPQSAHYPTVTDGDALILYLLPDGEIEFTGTAKGRE